MIHSFRKFFEFAGRQSRNWYLGCLLYTSQSGRELLQPDEVRMLDNQNALLFIRGERPILDAKYDPMKHPNIRYTEDGGAGPFNYAKAPLAHDDFTFDETRYNDYEDVYKRQTATCSTGTFSYRHIRISMPVRET